MNYKNIMKKETKVIAYVVICLTLVVVGVSYAMFLQVDKNTENQVVETGSLVITYQNGNGENIGEGDVITSSSCLEPMSDSDASIMTDCSYKLNILNKGSLPASYKIVMYNNVSELPSGKTFVDHSLIRVGLKKGNQTLESIGTYTLGDINKTPETASLSGQNNYKYILDEGTLEAGSDISYSVQTWINDALATAAVSGQYVYLKIDVKSVVTENAPITEDNDSGLENPA